MAQKQQSSDVESSGSEEAFLQQYDATRYPRPSVTVDIVLFTVVDATLRVLLIQRRKHPFRDHWALPGGFIRPDENAESAARRELEEEVGARNIFLEQLYTFSEPGRDPRTWVISIAYYALVTLERLSIKPGEEATDARWFAVKDNKRSKTIEAIPVDGGAPVQLAFDHAGILQNAVERIRGKLDYVPIGFQLLNEKFTLTELQTVHEAILGEPLDKRNFRSKVQRDGLVKPTTEMKTGSHRPAQLFKYAHRRYG